MKALADAGYAQTTLVQEALFQFVLKVQQQYLVGPVPHELHLHMVHRLLWVHIDQEVPPSSCPYLTINKYYCCKNGSVLNY